ncbi:MAG TPA: hypothetical protein EYP24_05355 [bacterium (Candidatus Stahlbacteria)]|nr:hypothetical protein [Candidatus Stahlbacteria bacterium]
MTILLLIVLSGNDPLAFAHHLYETGDYDLALLEYYRYHLNHPEEVFPILSISECYLRLERFKKAELIAEKLPAHMRNYIIGRTKFYEGSFDSSILYLKKSDMSHARLLTGLSFGHLFRFDSMASYLGITDYKIPSRSPILAGGMGIIPGLGHIYTGRYYDGLYSFFFTGLFAGFGYLYYKDDQKTKAGICLSLSGIFWLGNILGAINSARDYNRLEKTRYLKRIMARYPEEEFSPTNIWR